MLIALLALALTTLLHLVINSHPKIHPVVKTMVYVTFVTTLVVFVLLLLILCGVPVPRVA